MENKYLLHSFLYLLGAYVYYKIHKWWQNEPKEKNSNKDFKFMIFFKNWTIIIMLLLASLVSIIKSIK